MIVLGKSEEALVLLKKGARVPLAGTADAAWPGAMRHDPILRPAARAAAVQAFLA